MLHRPFLLCILTLISVGLYGQHPLSQFDKASHLDMLKDGVLLVRLSGQEKKLEELTKRGQSQAAQTLREETKIQNEQIIKAFSTHFDFCKVYFIRPEVSKTLLKKKSNTILDLASNEEIDLSSVEHIYVTSYSYGHPAEGYERYNRKGFQILYMEEGQLTDIGRDLFYVGVKRGFLAPKFSKSLQKSIVKLNKRLSVGSKYF